MPLVTETQFQSADMGKTVPLLYLANDMLQNNKRNRNEFVTAFWKVLPTAVKKIYEKRDDPGKKAVSKVAFHLPPNRRNVKEE